MPAKLLSFRLALFSVLSIACILPLHAQSSEADLKVRLMHKPLYLRGCWRDDKLHYDSTGLLIGTSSPIAFTLCGFDLKSLQLKSDKLVLEGVRVGLELTHNQVKRVQLMTGDPGRPETEKIQIEIDSPANNDYGPALGYIFLSNLEDLVPSMPFYWQAYAKKHFLPPEATSTPSESPETKVARSGGAIFAPVLVRSAAPKFTCKAGLAGCGGNVLVNVWVQPNGTVSHLSIVQAIGLGLDESALAAVQKYLFKPAMQDGKPVLVEVNIDVNFMIN